MEVDVAVLQDPRFWAPMICVGTSTEGVGDNRNVTLNLIQIEPNGRMVAYCVRVLGSHVLRPPYEPVRQPPAAQPAQVDMPLDTPHQPVVVPPPPSKPQPKARPAKSPEDHCHDSNRSIVSRQHQHIVYVCQVSRFTLSNLYCTLCCRILSRRSHRHHLQQSRCIYGRTCLRFRSRRRRSDRLQCMSR